jgi:hypothetical protein
MFLSEPCCYSVAAAGSGGVLDPFEAADSSTSSNHTGDSSTLQVPETLLL